jgi:hypothetical protein
MSKQETFSFRPVLWSTNTEGSAQMGGKPVIAACLIPDNRLKSVEENKTESVQSPEAQVIFAGRRMPPEILHQSHAGLD